MFPDNDLPEELSHDQLVARIQYFKDYMVDWLRESRLEFETLERKDQDEEEWAIMKHEEGVKDALDDAIEKYCTLFDGIVF